MEVAWLAADGGGTAPSSTITSGAGLAQTQWTLGSAAGSQNATASVAGVGSVGFGVTATQEARASSAGLSGSPVVFGATATAGAAAGSQLPEPLRVRATDAFGNPVSGVVVEWSTADGGALEPATAVIAADGTAQSSWTLGAEAGEQHPTATADGLAPVPFQATAIQPPPGE